MPPPKPGSILKLKQDHNEQIWKRYDMALDGHKDMATNRGFRMKDGTMYTYEQHKLGLSAYYDKRWVLEDGIHTEPIEYHTPNWTNGNLGHIPNHGARKKRFYCHINKKAARDKSLQTYIFREPPLTGSAFKVSSLSPKEMEALKSIPKRQIGRVLFKSQRTLVGGNTVSGGTTINSSRTKHRRGLSNK